MIGSRKSLERHQSYLTHSTARERMIGWYHTGPKLRASDQEINDLFKRFIARPVMVIVDVRPQTQDMPVDGYFAVEEIKDVHSQQAPIYLNLSNLLHRTEQKREKPSFTSHLQSKQKKRKKLVSSTFYAISKTRRQPLSQPASPSNYPLSAVCKTASQTFRNTSSTSQRVACP